MKEYEWKSVSDKYYFFHVNTGKIVGQAGKQALHEVFFGIVYTTETTYGIQDEKHLGQYISLEHAKKSVENYWDIQNRTLIP